MPAQPGVRHLHVEHRVLVGLALGQVHIEVERAGTLAHEEEIAGGVHADLLVQVAQGDELAAPLRHLHLFPAPHHLHQLHQRDVEEFGRIAQGGEHCPHPGDVAVMIGAPDVDDAVEPAVVLVDVVRDVGHEIGEAPVGLPQHPVLVVAEVRGAEPERAVGLEREPALGERVERALARDPSRRSPAPTT